MDFSAYSLYKPSHIEWIGDIPAHWDCIRLKFVVTFAGGGTPSKDNLDFWSGDIPWVSPKDMKYPTIRDTEDHVTDAAVRNSATRFVPPGTVLVVVRSGILKHSIPVAVTERIVTLNQDMKGLTPKPLLLPNYLAYFIRGHQSELLFEWRKEGATVESIEFELLANTKIPIPPLIEQQAIISYLDDEMARIDDLIAKKRFLVDLLLEKRSALIGHVVIKGLAPTTMKKSGIDWIGDIPASWEIRRLKWLVSFASRGDGPDYVEQSPIKVINQACIYWDGLRLDNVKYQRKTNISTWKGRLYPGDLLINSTGTGTLGRVAIFDQTEDFIADSHVTIMRVYPHLLNTRYMFYLLQSPLYQGYIYAALVAGSTNQIELSREGLRSTPIILPSLAEQQTIADTLDRETNRIDRMITLNRETIEKLQEYRAALIATVVKGKRDLKKYLRKQSEFN